MTTIQTAMSQFFAQFNIIMLSNILTGLFSHGAMYLPEELSHKISMHDNAEFDARYIVKLFIAHVFIKSYFLGHDRAKDTKNKQAWKFIRSQGLHAFKRKDQIPLFLKKAYLNSKGYLPATCANVVARQFDYATDHKNYIYDLASTMEEFETIACDDAYVSDFISSINNVKHYKELSHHNPDNMFIPVISKRSWKGLNNRFNQFMYNNNWDSRHNNFVKNFQFCETKSAPHFEYFADYVLERTFVYKKYVPSVSNMIDMLSTLSEEEIQLAVQFIDHFGGFDVKQLFGIEKMSFDENDIMFAFPSYDFITYDDYADFDDTFEDPVTVFNTPVQYGNDKVDTKEFMVSELQKLNVEMQYASEVNYNVYM